MVNKKTGKLKKEDWIRSGPDLLATAGVAGVKIVPLAKELGVTSGSFYSHFKNRGELHDALLHYCENEMTDAAIETARHIEPPRERIWRLMEQVMNHDHAKFDLAVWHWAQSDSRAREVFQRAVANRFAFAKWMFRQVGYTNTQTEARGRMMVVYMMGESTLIPDAPDKRRKLLKLKYEVLIHPWPLKLIHQPETSSEARILLTKPDLPPFLCVYSSGY